MFLICFLCWNNRYFDEKVSFAIIICACALDGVLQDGISGRVGGDEFVAIIVYDKG
ncbi:hypothetical protein [Clostridium chromiireducens]|uniref:hypothetical protein n=1 Tax=Clostridium chromiireducens TaxID=225345 RepID=UPI0015FCEB4F|nr:hypothetical protein [Clostridium chromiireducens]